jgi:MSHA biogenesis protein MshM
MYTAHFGLRELPFTITPDTTFYFAYASHHEALNTLLLAVRSGEGFMKVKGEVGTGKTLLCRKLLGALDESDFLTAYIPNPYVGPMTLLLAVADELDIERPESLNQHDLLKLLTKFLLDAYSRGRRVVLCLDEAQAMPIETLEALRLLTNLETERRKLLQVVLFGQPELDAKLANPAIRQLQQRISFSCALVPLSLADVEYYIAHRLSIAGYGGPRLFADRAVRRLYKASRGIPRLVNILSHKGMMVAFGEGVHHVEARHVRLAVRDTESVQAPWFRTRFARWLAPRVRT